jgi:valyl-tRNA synthetase
MHLEDYNDDMPVTLLPLDSWILERCSETVKRSRDLLMQYEIGAARNEIDTLFWKDFCDYYLEIAKDRLYKPEIHGNEARLSAQYALHHSLLEILKLYAVYVPFITEEIWQAYFCRGKTGSIHQTVWNETRCLNHDILEFGEAIKSIIFEVRKYKSERNLSLRTEIENLKIGLEKRFISLFKRNKKDLMSCTGAKNITILEGPLPVTILLFDPH